MTIGPIQAFVIGFPDNDLFEGRIVDELARLSEVGQIRVVDAVFVMREGDDVAVLSVSDLDDDQRAELRAAVGALVGLGVGGVDGAVAGAETGSRDRRRMHRLSPRRPAAALVDDLPDGCSALVLAIEHLWAIPLRDAVRDAGGIVLGHRSLTPEELIVFGMDLGDAIDAEASAESVSPDIRAGGLRTTRKGEWAVDYTDVLVGWRSTTHTLSRSPSCSRGRVLRPRSEDAGARPLRRAGRGRRRGPVVRSAGRCRGDAGATVAEIVEVLVGVVPIVGLPCAVAAAPKLAMALGYDIDDALEMQSEP